MLPALPYLPAQTAQRLERSSLPGSPQSLPSHRPEIRTPSAAGESRSGSSATEENRLAIVVTNGVTARYLMRGQLSFLARTGFRVSVLSGGQEHLDAVASTEGVECIAVPLERQIRPWSDLRALWKLTRALAHIRPSIVCASTPKAGLLGMVAATLVNVPHRVYFARGLRLETTRGLTRLVLRWMEKLAIACSHRVVLVSPSLRDAYVSHGLVRGAKSEVLGHGSSNGIDARRFAPPVSTVETDTASHPRIGFVGRLVRDKGIEDLVRAFRVIVSPRHPTARLVVLGEFEAGNPVSAAVREFLERDERVDLEGFVADSAPWYPTLDVLAFPSYREGLPNAPLEAAACCVPVVAYRATGTIDAVEHGLTGMLVERGDWQALGESLCTYIESPDLCQRHGDAARQWVIDRFEQRRVWRNWLEFYQDLVRQGGARQTR